MFLDLFQVDLSAGTNGQLSMAHVPLSMSHAYALSMSHSQPEYSPLSTEAPTPTPPTESVDTPKASAAQGNTSSAMESKANLAPGVIATITLLVAAALVVAGLMVYRRRMRQSHASSSISGETDITGTEA